MIDWKNSAVLCHNALFDGFVLAKKYGIVPGMYFDTLCMARAIHGVEAGGSLASLAKRYQIGEKGDEVVNAFGKRRADFNAGDLARYGDYCRNDCDLTYKLFGILSDNFPDDEFKLIDLTIRMFTDPVFQLDSELLKTKLKEVQGSKTILLNGLKNQLGVETEDEVRALLCSNPKFAKVLQAYGVKPPMKVSPTTGKSTLALAKTDEGFIELTEHEDPFIQQLAAVRLGTKSTLEESRIERFMGIAARNDGRLPVPLKYYGAHTGRWSGMDAVNFQNLPSRDKTKKTLKNSILPPPGHVVINADSSQIEARILAWWAGQKDVVDAFARGEDIYCYDASKAFGRTITDTEENKTERFVGKTMRLGLGYGTGAAKLQQTLERGGADISFDESKRLVDTWRRENRQITGLWQNLDIALQQMMGKNEFTPYSIGAVWITPSGIKLPNGMYIRYSNLRIGDDERMIYDSRKGPVNVWGGTVAENVTQALARIVIGQQMIWMHEIGYCPALTVHDSLVYVVPVHETERVVEIVTDVMSTPTSWAPTLPVACKVKFGSSYGEV